MRQFAVIGLGRFGYKVAESLAEKGAEVLAIDDDAEVIQRISDSVTRALELDCTDEDALRASGVQEVDVAVVGIGESIEASVLTTALLKKLGIPLIVARASSELHGQILEVVGANRVVYPEHDAAIRVAHGVLLPSVFDRIELPGGVSVAEIRPPKEFVGKTLTELELRQRYGLNVIVVKQTAKEDGVEEEVRMMPTPDYRIAEGDIMVVVGDTSAIEALY